MKFNKALLSVATAASIFAAGTVASADQIIVKAGDTVSELAQEYNTTVENIGQLNNLADVNFILVGQKLEVGNNGQAVNTNKNVNTASPVLNNTSQAVQSNNNNNNYNAYQAPSYNANTTQQATSNYNYQQPVGNYNEEAAKAWIANKESGGNYGASNGQYIGKYQLSASYLNGDYSAENQERVANQYVTNRYGSWTAAQRFWQSHGWY